MGKIKLSYIPLLKDNTNQAYHKQAQCNEPITINCILLAIKPNYAPTITQGDGSGNGSPGPNPKP